MSVPFKLNWSVKKNPDGTFVRRKLDGEDRLGLDYIDVEWTHVDGFLPESVMIPVTHPPHIRYEKKELPARKVVADMVGVMPSITDSTVSMMLDEKRTRLAQALGVKP